jgi:hypothetical protein
MDRGQANDGMSRGKYLFSERWERRALFLEQTKRATHFEVALVFVRLL